MNFESTEAGRGASAATTVNGYWHKNNGGSGPGPRIMAADTLEGNNVKNRADESIGEINHIMLDVPSGRIAYAVMAVGGFLSMGEKYFAIPWSALTLDTKEKCFRLDVNKERLSQAEGFDKDHWPTMADEKWARDLHTYYNARPYWDESL